MPHLITGLYYSVFLSSSSVLDRRGMMLEDSTNPTPSDASAASTFKSSNPVSQTTVRQHFFYECLSERVSVHLAEILLAALLWVE